MKTLSCREAGFDCSHVVTGETEEHATTVHGMKKEDFTPEFKEKLRSLMKNV
jgi:hypothetical protein